MSASQSVQLPQSIFIFKGFLYSSLRVTDSDLITDFACYLAKGGVSFTFLLI